MSTPASGSAGVSTPRVRIYPVPSKFVFLYPTILLAFVCALLQKFFHGAVTGDHPFGEHATTWGHMFLFVLFFNIIVVTFEFNRGSVFALVLGAAALVLGVLLLKFVAPGLMPAVWSLLDRVNSAASPWFYFAIFAGGVGMLVAVYAQTRFDYWELTPNELVHHRGVLGDTERYSTASLKMSKEITDVFEYAILRSARLVVNLPTLQRPILLENVLFVDHINRRAEEILEGGREVRAETVAKPPGQPPAGDV